MSEQGAECSQPGLEANALTTEHFFPVQHLYLYYCNWWFVNHKPSGQEFRIGHLVRKISAGYRTWLAGLQSEPVSSSNVLQHWSQWGLGNTKRSFKILNYRKFGNKHEFGAFHSSKPSAKAQTGSQQHWLSWLCYVVISIPLICYTDFRNNYQQMHSFFWGDEQRTQFKYSETFKHMATVWHISALLNWFARRRESNSSLAVQRCCQQTSICLITCQRHLAV